MWVWVGGGGGKNNIKEGIPHGSRAPVVTCGPRMMYRSAFSVRACQRSCLVPVCVGRGEGTGCKSQLTRSSVKGSTKERGHNGSGLLHRN